MPLKAWLEAPRTAGSTSQSYLNGADDRVRRAVFEQVTGANVVDVAVNLGFAGGCNLGAAEARGEFLAFLNDDATPEPEWLDKLDQMRTRPPRRRGDQ